MKPHEEIRDILKQLNAAKAERESSIAEARKKITELINVSIEGLQDKRAAARKKHAELLVEIQVCHSEILEIAQRLEKAKEAGDGYRYRIALSRGELEAAALAVESKNNILQSLQTNLSYLTKMNGSNTAPSEDMQRAEREIEKVQNELEAAQQKQDEARINLNNLLEPILEVANETKLRL